MEGSIPTKDNGIYCTIGGRSALDIATQVCKNAVATITVSACAFYGGWPSAVPNPTGAVGVKDAVPGITLINLPGCPPNAANITATVVHYLKIHNGEKWEPSKWKLPAQGFGFFEAPRGALGHWVRIDEKGAISNYQCVVPSTWNGSPRDANGKRGAWEEALVGNPVSDPERPIEILRTVHSFDPCMACAVRVMDTRGREVTRIKVV